MKMITKVSNNAFLYICVNITNYDCCTIQLKDKITLINCHFHQTENTPIQKYKVFYLFLFQIDCCIKSQDGMFSKYLILTLIKASK